MSGPSHGQVLTSHFILEDPQNQLSADTCEMAVSSKVVSTTLLHTNRSRFWPGHYSLSLYYHCRGQFHHQLYWIHLIQVIYQPGYRTQYPVVLLSKYSLSLMGRGLFLSLSKYLKESLILIFHPEPMFLQTIIRHFDVIVQSEKHVPATQGSSQISKAVTFGKTDFDSEFPNS